MGGARRWSARLSVSTLKLCHTGGGQNERSKSRKRKIVTYSSTTVSLRHLIGVRVMQSVRASRTGLHFSQKTLILKAKGRGRT